DAGLFGFVGFDSVCARGDFLPGETYLLRAFADVVRAVLMRRRAIVEMHAAQEELAKERAFLQGIVSTDAAGFVVLDATGAIIFANQAAETVLHMPLADLLGQRFDAPQWRLTDLAGVPLASDDHPFAKLRNGSPMVRNQRLALNLADGVHYISINAAPITNSCPASCQIVYAITDVTQLVEAEKAREAALEAAHRATQAKSSFLANMSHEIRTPLNGILGIAQILEDAITDPAQKQMAAILTESGELLMNILNDLLDMTKIEADAIELEIIPFRLADLARRVEEVHTLRASEKHLSFAVTLEDACGLDRLGDPHRLMQILHNLISNALKFTERGAVRVSISAPDATKLVLRVQDSGIGMTPLQAEHVMEPFAQADNSITRRFGGTGLGMAIVRRLVELMDGALQLDSVLGRGTTVTIALPLPVQPASAALQHYTPVGNSPLPALSVLAADDNRTNQMILGMMLGQLGAQVTLADDGLSALEVFRQRQFDLLILDISMPRLDGLALLREIRAYEQRTGRARCPAIAFTANAMTHQVQSYLDGGFDACVTKPLKLERLRTAIAQIIPPAAEGG
ncbi:MAG: response regulator, partial [Roseinatronobacter sp.]|nr:response regulator [Roseinatronobacter sp.]